MEKKMTKKDYFMAIMIECPNRQDIQEFCRHEIELLNKKSTKKGTNKKQKENMLIKEQIQELNFDEPKTLNEIAEQLEGEYSVQKLSALMKQLVDDGKFIRTKKDKKVAFEKVVE